MYSLNAFLFFNSSQGVESVFAFPHSRVMSKNDRLITGSKRDAVRLEPFIRDSYIFWVSIIFILLAFLSTNCVRSTLR